MPATKHAIAQALWSLADLIRVEHARRSCSTAARAVLGEIEPTAVAARFADYCVAALGSAVVRARFYRVGTGCVAGLELSDGRAVVVKAQRGGRSETALAACHRARLHLLATGFACPQPATMPTRGGGAWWSADELDERGARADAHAPDVRRAMAAALACLVDRARSLAACPAFSAAWFSAVPDGTIFPAPHSPAFDFDGTSAGAAWIDSLAAQARARRRDARGERVIGHFDWRVEHLRFENGRVATCYDWDSLHADREPVVVGAAAHAFTTDWQRDDLVRVPRRDELAAFVADYEAARERPFNRAERATVAASCVYSLAYSARCSHALCPRDEGANGDFRPLLRAHGAAILDDGL